MENKNGNEKSQYIIQKGDEIGNSWMLSPNYNNRHKEGGLKTNIMFDKRCPPPSNIMLTHFKVNGITTTPTWESENVYLFTSHETQKRPFTFFILTVQFQTWERRGERLGGKDRNLRKEKIGNCEKNQKGCKKKEEKRF